MGRSSMHKHEFELDERDPEPEFEDGVVMFCETCQYAEPTGPGKYSKEHDEVFRGYGPQCGEEKWYQFGVDYVKFLGGEDGPDLELTRGAIEWARSVHGPTEETVEDALHEVEMAQLHDELEIVSCDPDPDYGQVVARAGHVEVSYSAEHER